jgi:hypothetical protein
MRRAAFALVVCLTLGACDQEPVFDASNLIAYQSSFNAINARLNPADQHKLDIALRTLAGGYILAYQAVPLPGADGLTNVATLDGTIPREIYLARMRSSINGKSAAAIIKRVTGDLDQAIAYADLQPASAKHQLDALVVENPRYYWNRGKLVDQAFIEFSVYNGSKQPIQSIYLDAAVSSDKHEWARAGIHYGFSQPFEPGEMLQIKFSPPGPTGLADRQLESVYDPDFTLKVANAYDMNGNWLLYVNTDVVDAMRKQRELLHGG